MAEWYHHSVFNRYWNQFWVIQGWINHRRKIHEAVRYRAFREASIFQNHHCCACRHGFNHFCHYRSSGLTSLCSTQYKESNQHSCASMHDLKGNFFHHQCDSFKNSPHHLHSHNKNCMYSVYVYPKHCDCNSLRSFQNRPKISQNQQIQNVLKFKADKSPVMPLYCTADKSTVLPLKHTVDKSQVVPLKCKAFRSPVVSLKRKAGKSPTMNLKRKTYKSLMVPLNRNADKFPVVESLHENSDLEKSDSELEFVVTDQWMQIMAESQKFRQKRDALKKEKVDEDEDEEICEQDDGELSLQEKEDLKMIEMTTMYGYSASKIRAMEVAMQLSFERHCKAKKPHLWPVLPLKM